MSGLRITVDLSRPRGDRLVLNIAATNGNNTNNNNNNSSNNHDGARWHDAIMAPLREYLLAASSPEPGTAATLALRRLARAGAFGAPGDRRRTTTTTTKTTTTTTAITIITTAITTTTWIKKGERKGER
ncbi:hypothetical protein SAMD00023353_2601370 [Rosellinia necatrix]|uniref:Uncharacterized protein n=1 Tax=Rosellinia necatrix TaxID=77044 RepID=A0A1S8A8N9_ROSNE|nr:hypothetical protein SAMD00023353_2601370 [Rosellinia necatrix]